MGSIPAGQLIHDITYLYNPGRLRKSKSLAAEAVRQPSVKKLAFPTGTASPKLVTSVTDNIRRNSP
jgi:hypothetical protein